MGVWGLLCNLSKVIHCVTPLLVAIASRQKCYLLDTQSRKQYTRYFITQFSTSFIYFFNYLIQTSTNRLQAMTPFCTFIYTYSLMALHTMRHYNRRQQLTIRISVFQDAIRNYYNACYCQSAIQIYQSYRTTMRH